MSLFGLFLFCSDPKMAQKAASAGIDALIIDWEYKGKETRQRGFNTQINLHTVGDLQIVRAAVTLPIICRINPVNRETKREISLAIEHGASELLVPMIRSKEEVEAVLDWTKGKVKVGILIETKEAVLIASELSALPLSRIYIGLNDLSIAYNEKNLFFPLSDGRLQDIREKMTKPFGFGGLTLPHLGFPIPCRYLIDEMVRLKCQFSFLRRSFLKDVVDFSSAITAIREAIRKASQRTKKEESFSQKLLVKAIEQAGAYF